MSVPGDQQTFPRVLSIQSHVVQGHVGNKSAIFPLQLLGFEVDSINSVQFSNHTGYPTFKGTVTTGDELWSLVEGLEANGLLDNYTHLLTGYIGSLSCLETIVKVANVLREHNPNITFVCDPVMGDDGRLYCPPDLVPAFRDMVVPLGTLLTPNQFEAETLTGIKISSEADALRACSRLHEMGPQSVVG